MSIRAWTASDVRKVEAFLLALGASRTAEVREKASFVLVYNGEQVHAVTNMHLDTIAHPSQHALLLQLAWHSIRGAATHRSPRIASLSKPGHFVWQRVYSASYH